MHAGLQRKVLCSSVSSALNWSNAIGLSLALDSNPESQVQIFCRTLLVVVAMLLATYVIHVVSIIGTASCTLPLYSARLPYDNQSLYVIAIDGAICLASLHN